MGMMVVWMNVTMNVMIVINDECYGCMNDDNWGWGGGGGWTWTWWFEYWFLTDIDDISNFKK